MIYDEWIEPQSADRYSFSAIHPVFASILNRRCVTTADDYRRFVAPSIDDLHDPAGIHGILEAYYFDREAELRWEDEGGPGRDRGN